MIHPTPSSSSMPLEQYLIQQALAHPSSQPRDIIKQCYQAAFGAEHLLADQERAFRYLQQEYISVHADSETPLYESISDQVCRVNLAAWKHRCLPLDWLFRMFVASASIAVDRDQARELFLSYLDTADTLIRERRLSFSFSPEEWAEALSAYQKECSMTGFTAVHHSDVYRQAEQPSYRIIRQEYIRLLPILEAIRDHFQTARSTSSEHAKTATNVAPASIDLDQTIPCILAIDGRAASGKTTMADQLSQILGAEVIRMDDFFLPPELRTIERLQTPGGNVHYERFLEEVLLHLHDPQSFSYRRFDCHIMDYNGVRQIDPLSSHSHWPIRIVEGCYSHHPAFGDYADIRVFSHVRFDQQMARILHRNGPQMAQIFEQRWIPMEETYFRAYDIHPSSHIAIDSTNLF